MRNCLLTTKKQSGSEGGKEGPEEAPRGTRRRELKEGGKRLVRSLFVIKKKTEFGNKLGPCTI